VQNRLVPNALEPRAANASYDPGRDEYTVYLASQNPHLFRYLTARYTMPWLSEHKLHVIAPDVGGGFGSKTPQYNEEYLCLHGARVSGRPVKWVAERSESFVSDAHARDHVTSAEMALDADGHILAIRSRHVADLGAYAQIFGPVVPTGLYATMLSGVYTVPAIHAEVQLAFSNTVPTDAYRGAGRPEAAYTVERLIELGAAALGLSSAEIRRRNFIPKDAFPYAVCTGYVYDSGDYGQCLDLALAAADAAGFARRRDEARARGRLRGLGLSVYTEVAGIGPTPPGIAFGARMGLYEVSTARVNADASVTVLTGAHSHGQGHETSFAQIVADKLAMPLADIEIVHGDTARIPHGMGTWGSRSISLAGGALAMSVDKIIVKGRRIAAHVLEAPLDEIDFVDGYFKVKGSDRILSFKEVAHLAYLPGNYPLAELEPGLEETTFFDPPMNTFPAGCHCCEVEIDPETGVVEIVEYCVGDDFGVIINPLIVEGQVHGGVAQGVGQALYEHALYDPDSAQLLTGSFLDYCMPRADNLPFMRVSSIESTTPANVLGTKGCGEAGAIGAPAAVMNAVFDALKPLGITELSMPATPHKVWAAIQRARGAAA
jgi:carbon-monoxide dehydrogenase large subunit